MGGFMGVLGGIGQNIGTKMLDKETNKLQKSPVGSAIYNAYQSNRMNPSSIRNMQPPAGTPIPPMPAGMAPPPPPPVSAPPGSGVGVAPGTGGPTPPMSPMPTPPMLLSMQPDDPTGGMGSPVESLARGKIVTRPMIARIGENGPEAVVPLTPRAGNHMQPDIMEGHITPPKTPGIRYSRYTGYNRFGPGQGGVL